MDRSDATPNLLVEQLRRRHAPGILIFWNRQIQWIIDRPIEIPVDRLAFTLHALLFASPHRVLSGERSAFNN